MGERKLRSGDRAELSWAWEHPPTGRTVELLSDPDEDGMVQVRLVGTFYLDVEQDLQDQS